MRYLFVQCTGWIRQIFLLDHLNKNECLCFTSLNTVNKLDHSISHNKLGIVRCLFVTRQYLTTTVGGNKTSDPGKKLELRSQLILLAQFLCFSCIKTLSDLVFVKTVKPLCQNTKNVDI